MKSSDRMILFVLLGVVLVGALWFGLLSPKRSELAKLDDEVAEAKAQVSQAEGQATAGLAAKEHYRSDYEHLIGLGKAVPSDDDVAGFIDQVDTLATRAGVDFDSLKLASAGAAAPAPVAPAPSETGDEASADEESSAEGVITSAPATETAAADLPLGATVGAAGLPVMPYDLTFTGSFFEIADFMAKLDRLVRLDGDNVGVDGRLITVDGFTFAPDPGVGFPTLAASLQVTTFVAPADQGLTGGSSPAAPASAAAPAAPADASSGAAVAPTASATAPAP